jgi:hypothetical protein
MKLDWIRLDLRLPRLVDRGGRYDNAAAVMIIIRICHHHGTQVPGSLGKCCCPSVRTGWIVRQYCVGAYSTRFVSTLQKYTQT